MIVVYLLTKKVNFESEWIEIDKRVKFGEVGCGDTKCDDYFLLLYLLRIFYPPQVFSSSSLSRLSMSCFLDMKPCRFSFCRSTFYAFCKTTLINTPPAPAAATFMFRIFIHHMFVPFSPVCITFLAKFDTSDLRLNSVGGNSVGAYLK